VRSVSPARKLALLLAAVCLLALSACGDDSDSDSGSTGESTAEASGEKLKLALFVPLKNSYVDSVIKATTAETEALGGTVEVFDANFDAAAQLSQIQDAIASQNFNSFIVYPLDAAGVVPPVEEALAADIKVGVETTPVGKRADTAEPQVEGISVSSVNPPALDGESMAKAVVEACGDHDPCNVLHVAGDFAFYYDVGFLEGLKKGLEGTPAKLVQTVKGADQADPAFNAVRDALQARDDIHVVTSTSDVMMGGAERAVSDAGLEPNPDGGVALIGNGGSAVAAEGIKKGTWWGSVVWLPEVSSKRNVEALQNAINGKETNPPGVYTASELSPIGLFLRPDNAAEFEPQWEGN
jgi:ABC-type sugar transport system substrate-binding protein